MSEYKASNVTKYDVGGPENIIQDGLIKSVEKVWCDDIAFTAVVVKDDTYVIARIPPGKRITDVIVCYPVMTTAALLTGSTLAVGTNDDLDKFIDDVDISTFVARSDKTLSLDNYYTMARMNNADGFQYLTTGSTFTPIVLSLGRQNSTTASGTIKTIVKYV